MEKTVGSKRKREKFFTGYISKVLKQISTEACISLEAKQELNLFLCAIAKKISKLCLSCLQFSAKKIISVKEIESSLNIFFQGDLKKLCIDEGNRAIKNYSESLNSSVLSDSVITFEISKNSEIIQQENFQNMNQFLRETINEIEETHSVNSFSTKSEKEKESENSFSQKETKRISKQQRADIIFPPSILTFFLKNFGYYNVKQTKNSSVYFAGFMEYICAELLDISYNNVVEDKRRKITVEDLHSSINEDEEFKTLFSKLNLNFMLTKEFVSKRKSRKKEIFSKSMFRKVVRKSVKEIIQKNFSSGNHSFKISKKSFVILQDFIEKKILNILSKSNLICLNSGRTKLSSKDILLICKLDSICIEKKEDLFDLSQD
jgi:histone H3/H4